MSIIKLLFSSFHLRVLLSGSRISARGVAVGLCLLTIGADAQTTKGEQLDGVLNQRPQTAIIRLPFQRFFREVRYEVREGRAIYQGDIDLGSVQEVEAKSASNQAAFESGSVDINFFKPRNRTRYLALKQQLEAQFIPDFAEQLDRQRSSVILDADMLWPGGRVPVEIPSGEFSQAVETQIQDALDTIESMTTLQFTTRTREKNYIRFRNTNDPNIGGSSPVGMQGGRQSIRINPTTAGPNTIIHEVAHSLGLYHTQSRADRDQFVCLRTTNILPNRLHNFDIHDGDDGAGVFGSYNARSVMHYNSCAFSVCGDCNTATSLGDCTTIIGRGNNGICNQIITSNNPVQATDWDAINFLYDPNFEPTASSSTRNVSITISRVTTTAGPEENGIGCNDRMDYFGEITGGVLADLGEDPYRFVQAFPMPLNEVEGNDIRPDWRHSFIMGPNDLFGLIQIRLIDDDKKGGLGIGACGREDDPVDISPLAGTTLQLVVDLAHDAIHQSQTVATQSNGVMTISSTLNGVAGNFGEELTFRGNTGSHRAEVRITVDVH